MSISTALNSALSGLTAASRSAQVVSANISNALTPGYGRREIELSSAYSGGVQVSGVTRSVSPALIAERRIADAELGSADTLSQGRNRLLASLGDVGSVNSIAGRVGRFDALLLEAASDPSSSTRLSALASGASDLASALNAASQDVQSVRQSADAQIGAQVAALNEGLARIDGLNADILRASIQGGDLNTLKDLRQGEIDSLSAIVPLRQLERPNNAVSLITAGGQLLLQDSPAEISFTPTGGMSPATVLGLPLSGLTIDGRAVDMTLDRGRMAGGSLQANFEMRDSAGVEAQAQLDGLARDLIERMAAIDSSIPPGAPGLFTDTGASFAAANELGLASRISLNALADPSQGGDAWRLRDGLMSPAPGPQGDSTLIQAWRAALNAAQSPSSPVLGSGALNFGGQADTLMSFFGSNAQSADDRTSFASAQLSGLIGRELEQGVDTDSELQKLLLIEQIYGANTKVVQAADSMLQRLLEI